MYALLFAFRCLLKTALWLSFKYTDCCKKCPFGVLLGCSSLGCLFPLVTFWGSGKVKGIEKHIRQEARVTASQFENQCRHFLNVPEVALRGSVLHRKVESKGGWVKQNPVEKYRTPLETLTAETSNL